MKKHLNSQKRFYSSEYIYFITTNTHKWTKYFEESLFCDLFIENLKICKRIQGFQLFAFCLIYNHLHLLLQPNDRYNISKVMQSLKQNVSADINRVALPRVGGTPASRLRTIYRNKGIELDQYREKFQNKYKQKQRIFPKFKWHGSFRDHIIRNEEDLEHHYYYTVNNYIKHGLPKDWQYTSLKYPKLIDQIII